MTIDQLNLGLLGEILKYLGRMSTDNRVSITDATDYINDNGFFLYVGVAGNVTYTDMAGRTATKLFTAGYHPTKFKKITGATTTATDLDALF